MLKKFFVQSRKMICSFQLFCGRPWPHMTFKTLQANLLFVGEMPWLRLFSSCQIFFFTLWWFSLRWMLLPKQNPPSSSFWSSWQVFGIKMPTNLFILFSRQKKKNTGLPFGQFEQMYKLVFVIFIMSFSRFGLGNPGKKRASSMITCWRP